MVVTCRTRSNYKKRTKERKRETRYKQTKNITLTEWIIIVVERSKEGYIINIIIYYIRIEMCVGVWIEEK